MLRSLVGSEMCIRDREYRNSSKVCKGCRFREICLGKTAKEKRFTVTYFREEYERNNARIATPKGKVMKGKRQSTVEPVFGTLTQFMGLRKINTIGIKQANKVMHLSAMAYNLKKYLKFTQKLIKSEAKAKGLPFFIKNRLIDMISSILSLAYFII